MEHEVRNQGSGVRDQGQKTEKIWKILLWERLSAAILRFERFLRFNGFNDLTYNAMR